MTGDLRHLEDEAQLLHARLHRVAVALAITMELIANTYDDIADEDDVLCPDAAVSAKMARGVAETCRAFVIRLDGQERIDPFPADPT
ncbi:MAG TPA: hypothetical protein VFH54_11900 [Mycobacteriales bacterium]|nr:hypothetical protein [Mycobacteriales bacterium]